MRNGKKSSKCHSPTSTFLFLANFGAICDLLLNRWNLFVTSTSFRSKEQLLLTSVIYLSWSFHKVIFGSSYPRTYSVPNKFTKTHLAYKLSRKSRTKKKMPSHSGFPSFPLSLRFLTTAVPNYLNINHISGSLPILTLHWMGFLLIKGPQCWLFKIAHFACSRYYNAAWHIPCVMKSHWNLTEYRTFL